MPVTRRGDFRTQYSGLGSSNKLLAMLQAAGMRRGLFGLRKPAGWGFVLIGATAACGRTAVTQDEEALGPEDAATGGDGAASGDGDGAASGGGQSPSKGTIDPVSQGGTTSEQDPHDAFGGAGGKDAGCVGSMTIAEWKSQRKHVLSPASSTCVPPGAQRVIVIQTDDWVQPSPARLRMVLMAMDDGVEAEFTGD